MQGSRLGLVAAVALLAGSAGCSLPQVLPLEGGTTAGPSPYGVWYEQHWATNSILLAAADQPEEEVTVSTEAEITVNVDTEIGAAPYGAETGEYADPIDADAQAAAQEARRAADEAAAAANASVEARARQAEQFDDSSPYQFPASSFAPGTGEEVPGAGGKQTDSPIRY